MGEEVTGFEVVLRDLGERGQILESELEILLVYSAPYAVMISMVFVRGADGGVALGRCVSA